MRYFPKIKVIEIEDVFSAIIVFTVAWTENISNEEVLRRMGTDREIVRQFKMRKLQYPGHHIRHNTSQLIDGKI